VGKSGARKEKRFWVGGIFSVFFLSILTISPNFSFTWAAEEVYPNRPINLVVSMTPGGVLDTDARLLGRGWVKSWGNPFFACINRGVEEY
jgi:tripartite-type tricarboxylate transporter receptor subunit TctC